MKCNRHHYLIILLSIIIIAFLTNGSYYIVIIMTVMPVKFLQGRLESPKIGLYHDCYMHII